MSRRDKEDKELCNHTVLDRLTRLEQHCSYCKPNRGENASRKPKQDKYKNKDRSSIRKQVVEDE